MRVAAFVRYKSADGLGHLGWAFDCDSSLVDCGAVENPSGKLTIAAVDMGFWTDTTDDPLPDMRRHAYDDAKYIDLQNGNPARAYATVLWIAAEAYKIIGRNCLDDAYDVLASYGVSPLPLPSQGNRAIVGERSFDFSPGGRSSA